MSQISQIIKIFVITQRIGIITFRKYRAMFFVLMQCDCLNFFSSMNIRINLTIEQDIKENILLNLFKISSKLESHKKREYQPTFTIGKDSTFLQTSCPFLGPFSRGRIESSFRHLSNTFTLGHQLQREWAGQGSRSAFARGG